VRFLTLIASSHMVAESLHPSNRTSSPSRWTDYFLCTKEIARD